MQDVDFEKVEEIIFHEINSDPDAVHTIKVDIEQDGDTILIDLLDTSTDLHGKQIDIHTANNAVGVAAQNVPGAVVRLHPDVTVVDPNMRPGVEF